MFGGRLKRLRKQENWTIEEVAERLNIAKSTYAGYETEDRKPPIEKLIKLSKLYDVSVDYIIGLTDEPDIKTLEYDASKYLRKDNINWKGVPLTKEILNPITDLLEIIACNNLNKQERDFAKITTANKRGDFIVIDIPQKLAGKYGVETGSEVKIIEENGGIMLRPVKSEPTLDDLLAQVTDENRHEEIW